MMNHDVNKKLFTPTTLGALDLRHRVVMAPLTRSRAVQSDSTPSDLMVEYYSQRASDGGLIISEATNISVGSRGWLGAPGLYSEDQVQGWRKVVDAVHAKGGLLVAQLWHTGRSAHVDLTGGKAPVSASVNPAYWQDASHLVSTPAGWVQPSPHRALTVQEIKSVINDYWAAAVNARNAGFDGVELHAGNGYLIDQFLQSGSNQRSDDYGGSVENRSRFLSEVTAAVVSVWHSGRVGVRIAPSGSWNGMSDLDSKALFRYVAEGLNVFDLAYLHVIEPRVVGSVVPRSGQPPVAAEHLRNIFKGKLLAAGGFEPETAESIVAGGVADAVAFGRHFVSNPDLPRRIQLGLPLARYDRDTFFTFEAQGYTDYPLYQQLQST